MRCYRNAPARKRWVDTAARRPDPEQLWIKKKPRDFRTDMNAVLRLYLNALREVIDGTGQHQALKLKANLCTLTAESFVQCHETTN
eukprot:6870412-Pyramimonas_sp.AAC.1